MKGRRRSTRRADAGGVAVEDEALAGTDVSGDLDAGTVDAGMVDAGMVDTERALRLVRTAAALIAMAAVLGVRTDDGPWLHGPAAAAAIFAGAMAINLVLAWMQRRGWPTATALVGQILDVAGSLALVVLLDQALNGSAWMVMLLPIVMGGVRFGAAGTLLAWALACAGYLVLVLTGVIEVADNKADEFAASVQQFAFLLALAVPVAALTQWLQHRWEHQRGLTVAASLRAQRLELVEALARSFTGSTEPRLLANLADAGVRLGFPTVTITLHSGDRAMTVAAVGASRSLPTEDVAIRPTAGETLVTHWSGTDETLTSVSIMLDATGSAIAFHGWTTDDELDESLAQAFGLLGAHASVALRAARMLADLERQAKQDPLTGLLNRRAFDEQVDLAAATGTSVAMLFLDVDHFKAINDTYGHPAGDRVLTVIAERLRGAVEAASPPIEAAIARVGGDEFALLLTDAPLDAVAGVAERIEEAMRTPVSLPSDAVAVSFSIGIADAAGRWTPRELITAADTATYEAKTAGRNRTSWADGPVGIDLDTGAPHGSRRPEATTTPTDDGPDGPTSRDPLITLFERSMDAPTAPFDAATTPPQRPPS